MKKLKWLDKGIKDIIETFEYEVYIVHVEQDIDCPCKNFTTKQGDPSHKLCLGTGQKIRIRKIKASSEETSSSFRNTDMSESGTGIIYYVDAKYSVNQNDLIVDGEQIFLIHRVERSKGTGKEQVYQKCIAINKKADNGLFLKNFREIVER